MAFLDNSGDIILDAVLTETGRLRLAKAAKDGGSGARIVAYALGDDEINYGQYDLNNTSGSNYADLEILQTPILEAFTSINAGINYGLLKLTNPELLFLPSLKVNEKYAPSKFPALQAYNNIYYFAVNNTTYNTLNDLEPVGSVLGSPSAVGRGMPGADGPFVFIEGGLNTTTLSKTFVDRNAYVVNTGITNGWYNIGMDNRIYGNVYTNSRGGRFQNRIIDNTDMRQDWEVKTRQVRPKVSKKAAISNYDFFWAPGRPNHVVVPDSGGTASQYSVIDGPGDTICCFKFTPKRSLRTDGTTGGSRDILYNQIGSVSVSSTTLFGSAASKFYDYIDTIVYVFGAKTGASISIPVRIIRQVSS